MSDKKVEYTYTGEGDTAHKITFKTKNDNTCTTNYLIKDCYYEDGDWYNHYNRITIDDNGTLSCNTSSAGFYLADKTGTATNLTQCIQHTPPFSFEFDVENPYGNAYLHIADANTTVNRKFLIISQTKKHYHIKVEVLTDRINYYVDGVYKSDLTWTGTLPGNVRIGFRLDNGSSVRIDNFIIYSLGDGESLPSSIVLSSDKSVLSYYDSESATLSATVLNSSSQPIEGVTVEFFNGSTSMGTADTNSSGIATKTYTSTGAGDISLTAQVSPLISETYSLKDAYYYHESAFTSTQSNFNVPLPSNFEITFYTKRTSNSSNSAYLEIGGNSGNTALCGQIGGSGMSRVRIYNSEGSSSYTAHSASDTPSGVNALHTWVKNGNENSYHTQSTTAVTWTDNITHSKIRKLSITSNRIEQLLVMPK